MHIRYPPKADIRSPFNSCPLSAKSGQFADLYDHLVSANEHVDARAGQSYSGSTMVSVMSLPKVSRASPGIVNVLITRLRKNRPHRVVGANALAKCSAPLCLEPMKARRTS